MDICAFANEPGLGGGTIVFGVQLNKKLAIPAYEVIGIEASDTVSANLASQCASLFNITLRPVPG
ncbi:MAG: ATP-binding protein [Planctomycetaceae bacterium]|nr:ATP-binding protein [Planctomycetaceae bacterium]